MSVSDKLKELKELKERKKQEEPDCELKERKKQEVPDCELKELDLSNKDIKVLRAGDFAKFKNLTTLNLSGNQIEKLDDPKIFEGLGKLKCLDLSNNKINFNNNTSLFGGLCKDVSRMSPSNCPLAKQEMKMDEGIDSE